MKQKRPPGRPCWMAFAGRPVLLAHAYVLVALFLGAGYYYSLSLEGGPVARPVRAASLRRSNLSVLANGSCAPAASHPLLRLAHFS
jgi:hypothetical protein